jgi:hypothetical protein
MVQDPLLECKFFIPVLRDAKLSDGHHHEERFWEWLVFVLFDKFGGNDPGRNDPRILSRSDTSEQVGDESHEFTVAI